MNCSCLLINQPMKGGGWLTLKVDATAVLDRKGYSSCLLTHPMDLVLIDWALKADATAVVEDDI